MSPEHGRDMGSYYKNSFFDHIICQLGNTKTSYDSIYVVVLLSYTNALVVQSQNNIPKTLIKGNINTMVRVVDHLREPGYRWPPRSRQCSVNYFWTSPVR